jgi:hypothetical protein
MRLPLQVSAQLLAALGDRGIRGIEHPAEKNEAVHHVRILAVGDFHAVPRHAFGVFAALVHQGIVARRDQVRGWQACQALREQGRGAPVEVVFLARQVLRLEIIHGLLRQQVALAVAPDRRMRQALIGRRVDQQLIGDLRLAGIARE